MNNICDYIDRDVEEMLADSPFCEWIFEKTSVDDLPAPETHYEFQGRGVGVRCDREGKVDVIFLYVQQECDQKLFNIPFNWNREQVRGYFGIPTKSSNGSRHPVLGEILAWDQFCVDAGVLHFEYSIKGLVINKITIMSSEAAPQ